MSERGWLKEVLEAARADVNAWPEWMRQSSTESTYNLGASTQPESSSKPQYPQQPDRTAGNAERK